MQKYQKWKKKITISDYNKFANNILDANITEKKLVSKYGSDEKIKTAAKEEINSSKGRIKSTAR